MLDHCRNDTALWQTFVAIEPRHQGRDMQQPTCTSPRLIWWSASRRHGCASATFATSTSSSCAAIFAPNGQHSVSASSARLDVGVRAKEPDKRQFLRHCAQGHTFIWIKRCSRSSALTHISLEGTQRLDFKCVCGVKPLNTARCRLSPVIEIIRKHRGYQVAS